MVMNGSLAVQIGELVLLILGIVVLHELAHVVVARVHGYRTVCMGISPLAVGIVFLDQPHTRYWSFQVVVPLLVTATATYAGLIALPITAAATQAALPGGWTWQFAFAIGLAVLSSSGDMASMLFETRRPLWGRDRVVRDVRLLKKIGGMVRFTAFGRQYIAREFGLSPQQFVKQALIAPATRKA